MNVLILKEGRLRRVGLIFRPDESGLGWMLPLVVNLVGLIVVDTDVDVVTEGERRGNVGRKRGRPVVGWRLCFIFVSWAREVAAGLWMLELLRRGLSGAT